MSRSIKNGGTGPEGGWSRAVRGILLGRSGHRNMPPIHKNVAASAESW